MEKRRVAIFLDNIFLVVGIWLLSYLWTRYYIMNLLVALIAATSIALCVVMLINLRRQRNKAKAKKQKRIDNIMNQFLYGGKDFALDFLFDSLNKKFSAKASEQNPHQGEQNLHQCEQNPLQSEQNLHQGEQNSHRGEQNSHQTEQTNLDSAADSILTAQKKVKRCDGFLLLGQTAVFSRFIVEKISLQDIIECYVAAKKVGAKRVLVLSLAGADKLSASALNNLPDIKIEVFDKNKSYDFIGYLGCFPQVTIQIRPQKTSLKGLIAGAFAKNKAKHYLAISVVLMISSYFVAYSIYYIVAASVALVLSLLSRFNILRAH